MTNIWLHNSFVLIVLLNDDFWTKNTNLANKLNKEGIWYSKIWILYTIQPTRKVKYYDIVQINQNPHKSGIWFLY